MSFFDHSDGDKPDWMIVYFPQIFLGACLTPVAVFIIVILIGWLA